MTTTTLRAAATKTRALAEAARTVAAYGEGWDAELAAVGRSGYLLGAEREYAQAMHPLVGLAIADLLDGWADDIDRYGGKTSSDNLALNLARAVLGNEGDQL